MVMGELGALGTRLIVEYWCSCLEQGQYQSESLRYRTIRHAAHNCLGFGGVAGIYGCGIH